MYSGHVQVVGSTGVGKSAHIQLLSGNLDVVVSDEAKSCTTETRVVKGRGSECFIDTVGAEDSRNLSDKKVLNETQRELMKCDVKNLKVIWIINPNTRETSTLQTQARFIQVMHPEIWKALIIIIKEPGGEIIAKSQGAKEAIKHCGGMSYLSQIPILGYHNIDWNKKFPSYVPKLNDEERHEGGYYNSKEVLEMVTEKLNVINAVELNFSVKKCKKCGVKGDPRYSDDIECHIAPIETHEKNAIAEQVHVGEKKKVHDRNVREELYHPKPLLIHPKQKEFYHHGEIFVEWIHDESTYKEHATSEVIRSIVNVSWSHPSSSSSRACPSCGNTSSYSRGYYHTESWVSTWACRKCCSKIHSGSHFYHCDQCCDRKSSHSGGRSFVMGCTGMFDSCGNDSTISKCGSCNRDTNSQGCREEIRYNYTHKCCNSPQGTYGCVEKCSSCKQDIKKKGCIRDAYYLCCKRKENEEGCREKWSCCGTDIIHTATGCKISCCEQLPGSDGCKKQYSCCKEPVSEGKECKTEWSCCEGFDGSLGCKLKWSCCLAIVSLNNPNDKLHTCQLICQLCERNWGDTPGCSEESTHEFESIE